MLNMSSKKILLVSLTVLVAFSFHSFCFAFAYQGLDSSPRQSHPLRQNFHFPRSLFLETDGQIGVPLSPKLEDRGDVDVVKDLDTYPEQDGDSSEVSNTESSQRNKKIYLKRRKGPTLSVVNPLEILRQQLMLDLARRRIHQNEKQIVANTELLENLGKRSSNLVSDALFRFLTPEQSEAETLASDERSDNFVR